MKIIWMFITATLCTLNPVSSQILCTAPDSIIDSYRNDADLLALRAIYRENLANIDSIEIPSAISDYYLNALLAVYNATHIPERDTIIELLDIHTFPDQFMDRVRVAVDSNAWWLQKLRLNEIPTGYAALDNLMSKYNLSVEEIENWNNWFEWHSVIFRSTRNLNIPPLAVAFESLDSVHFAEPWNVHGDGSDIREDFIVIIPPLPQVNLFYTFGWGDCLSGCTQHRTWWLSVNGCSVNFINTFGSPLPFTAIDDVELNLYKAWPNPFHDQIHIDGAEGFTYSILSLNGLVVSGGISLSSTIEQVGSLMPGIYFIQITDGYRNQVFKMVKQ